MMPVDENPITNPALLGREATVFYSDDRCARLGNPSIAFFRACVVGGERERRTNDTRFSFPRSTASSQGKERKGTKRNEISKHPERRRA